MSLTLSCVFVDPCGPCDSCHGADVTCGTKALASSAARYRKVPCETVDSIGRPTHGLAQQSLCWNLASRSQQAYEIPLLGSSVEEVNSGRRPLILTHCSQLLPARCPKTLCYWSELWGDEDEETLTFPHPQPAGQHRFFRLTAPRFRPTYLPTSSPSKVLVMF